MVKFIKNNVALKEFKELILYVAKFLNDVASATKFHVARLEGVGFSIQIFKSLITRRFCYLWSFLRGKLYLSNIMVSSFYS